MTSTIPLPLIGERPSRPVANEISDRLSEELVIALVGPIASGVSTAARYIRAILQNDFGYDVPNPIKLSDIIRREAHRVGQSPTPDAALGNRISKLQDAGNSLRDKFGEDYLAEKAIEQIFTYRRTHGGLQEGTMIPIPGKRAYIIDSLKHRGELDLLRSIYKDTLLLFGVFAPDAVRRQRLIDNGTEAAQADTVLNRDQGEIETFGQMTRKIFEESDFFLCNDRKEHDLRSQIDRYLGLLFDSRIHTPTRAESAMYEASAVAVKSACMSRQVGAAIVSNAGELIAVGWNDVPKFGGGLYEEDDQSVIIGDKVQDLDKRCFRYGQRICHNETRRNDLINTIVMRLVDSKKLKKGTGRNDLLDALKGTDIDAIIEYSRSIHAEMEAILSVAREGRHSLVGATLYTTTYPCHNCARHIVASGIKEVIYIEPYKKSLAIALHGDAITEDWHDKSKVLFRQYDGVSPRIYLKLFRVTASRKANGRLLPRDPKSAKPRFRFLLDGFVEYESKVIADLNAKEQSESGDSGGSLLAGERSDEKRPQS
ncbi:deoxycytidylate deaminase [Mycobacterium sp. KBS0706]|uniref:anti-phage dCTP deaminase n=1 Tax=Mycobacterium sp. KBS0706 TaxID=2578109 RepID=UPI00110FAE90|nr:anti-phage dCTP deaminase [Mycobacterium sp. KBS0706]TSD83643.1 deoxycytidylate deaminase [Mycobacterium sp. KBS0706]